MSITGTFYIVFGLAMMGTFGVFQAHVMEHISPEIFVFYSFLISFLIFSLFNLVPHPKKIWNKCKGNWPALVLLNLSSLLAWGAYMFALKYLEPAICVIFGSAIGPLLMIIFLYYLRPQSRIHVLEKVASLGILFGLCFVVIASLLGKSALVAFNAQTMALGFALATINGVGQVLFGIYSKKISDKNFSPAEIMTLRFPLCVLIVFMMTKNSELMSIFQSKVTFLSVMGVSIFGVMLPAFILQKGIRLIEPIYLSILMLIEPIFIFIAQWFDPRLRVSWFSYFGVCIIFLFCCLSVVGRYKQEHLFFQRRHR